jgi:hypothetical protein
MRNFYLMAVALTMAVVAPVGPYALAQHEHAEHFMKCAKVCADCQVQCDSCFKHCLTRLAEDKKEHAKTAQLCADNSECCKTCSSLCARESPLANPMLECCAKCCDECALRARSSRTTSTWQTVPSRVGIAPRNAARCSSTSASEPARWSVPG